MTSPGSPATHGADGDRPPLAARLAPAREHAPGAVRGDGAPTVLAHEPLTLGERLHGAGPHPHFAGVQGALRRDVVVVRAGDADPDTLLTEALVGAALEHPSVVPVHAAVELDGAPAIVMRRVDGTPWRDAIEDSSRLPAAGRADPRAFHLRVLVAVANALAFAHRRGIVHRALSTERVLLGAFGEVYVLGWGRAAATGVDAPAWLRADAREAPEHTDPAIDVRALADALVEIVGADALEGTPLATLVRGTHAGAAASASTDAAGFRDSVTSYLARREADALAAAAAARVDALVAALDAGADEGALFRGLGEVRLSLREALEAGADRRAIAVSHARAHTAITRWALDAGLFELAATHLAELDPPPAELTARLHALRADAAARRARVARLEALAADENLASGASFRRRVGVALGAVFLLANVAMGALERHGGARFDEASLRWVGAGVLAVLAPFTWTVRRTAFHNRANRAFFGVCILLFFVVEALWWLGPAVGLPARTTVIMSGSLYLLHFGAVTALVNPAFWPSALAGLASVVGACLAPAYAYEWLGAGVGFGVAALGFAAGESTTLRDDAPGSR